MASLLQHMFKRKNNSRQKSPRNTLDMDSYDEPITLAIIGCGQRGKAYASYAISHPTECKVVAIAEPRPRTQRIFADTHNIDQTLVFTTWQDLHAASAETLATVGRRLADAVIIAVQDHLHSEVAVAFAEQGYHMLCEKPMANSIEECLKMEHAIKKAGVIFGMGHVLRYSPYTQAITKIVRKKTLGDLINVVLVEPVGYWHFAHSYVRGNWSQEEKSAFVLMTKCCHDIDLLCHWFAPSTPTRVSSFGSLNHFRRANKPPNAGNVTRCIECPVEKDCPYSAKQIYLDAIKTGNTRWPVSVLVDGVPDIENVTQALKQGPYGLCVYESPNDVCDNQVVNFEFTTPSSTDPTSQITQTASFTMAAQTSLICERQLRMSFSHGEIVGDMRKFTMVNFRTGERREEKFDLFGGHGGGDWGLMESFVRAVREGNEDALGMGIQDGRGATRCAVEEVLKSHLTVFAAETSRKEGKIIDCAQFEKEVREVYVPNGQPKEIGK